MIKRNIPNSLTCCNLICGCIATGCAFYGQYHYAVLMRRTEPGDLLQYCKYWLEFQKRFAEVLPMIPLYSNVYFDFYTNTLHDYAVDAVSTWAQAIVPAYLAEYVEEVPEEAEGAEIPGT